MQTVILRFIEKKRSQNDELAIAQAQIQAHSVAHRFKELCCRCH